MSAPTLHRRPSGEPPPLARPVYRTDWLLLAGSALLLVVWLVNALTFRQGSLLRAVDDALLDAAVALRSNLTVDLSRAVAAIERAPVLQLGAAAALVGLAALKRLRRFFVFLGAWLVALAVLAVLQRWLAAPRPFDVDILGRWYGYASPSRPVGELTVVLLAVAYCYLPAGRVRTSAIGGAVVVLLVVATANAILAVEYPSDSLVGAAIGAVVVVFAFRLLAPDESFPVSYGGGTAAHLDLGGERGEAIRRAVGEQLGLEVLDVKPFGLAGSGGSSPMKLTIAGDPPRSVFAKLLAAQHVRSDRWYKLGRTLLYGRLEDERSFSSVRRLVEYEDYLMRAMHDAGAPVVHTYGPVELSPEREYLLVTDFAEGARELGDPDVTVDDAVIDDGLRTVRVLWDHGLAHRDVKPANVLVRDGRVVLIDLGFSAVRPTPWRQAVDLANMMLCLALGSTPELVYERAMQRFTSDDVAEAFAATKGLTVPTQLQELLQADGRDLVGDFRRLAPARPPIPIQRWSWRRVGLTVGVAAAVIAGVALFVGIFVGNDWSDVGAPECPDSSAVLLMGQAVPGARYVPCVANLPAEWSVEGSEVDKGEGRFAVDFGGGGGVDATFSDGCDPGRAEPIEGRDLPPGVRGFAEQQGGAGERSGSVYLEFAGGCVTYDVTVTGQGTDVQGRIDRVFRSLSLVARSQLDAAVARDTHGRFTRL